MSVAQRDWSAGCQHVHTGDVQKLQLHAVHNADQRKRQQLRRRDRRLSGGAHSQARLWSVSNERWRPDHFEIDARVRLRPIQRADQRPEQVHAQRRRAVRPKKFIHPPRTDRSESKWEKRAGFRSERSKWIVRWFDWRVGELPKWRQI